jgi:chromosome segregation ATPase
VFQSEEENRVDKEKQTQEKKKIQIKNAVAGFSKQESNEELEQLRAHKKVCSLFELIFNHEQKFSHDIKNIWQQVQNIKNERHMFENEYKTATLKAQEQIIDDLSAMLAKKHHEFESSLQSLQERYNIAQQQIAASSELKINMEDQINQVKNELHQREYAISQLKRDVEEKKAHLKIVDGANEQVIRANRKSRDSLDVILHFLTDNL